MMMRCDDNEIAVVVVRLVDVLCGVVVRSVQRFERLSVKFVPVVRSPPSPRPPPTATATTTATYIYRLILVNTHAMDSALYCCSSRKVLSSTGLGDASVLVTLRQRQQIWFWLRLTAT